MKSARRKRPGVYEPHPIDTARVELGAEFDGLIAQLSENAHANWAEKRLSDGWKFGPARDDERKEHPSLVSYVELSEDEKDYDRVIVTETIKAMIALGYRLVKVP